MQDVMLLKVLILLHTLVFLKIENSKDYYFLTPFEHKKVSQVTPFYGMLHLNHRHFGNLFIESMIFWAVFVKFR